MAQEEYHIHQDAQKVRPARPQANRNRRRYRPHFVGPFAHSMDLGERKNPSSTSLHRESHRYVEDFDELRTKLAGFFSILLAAKGLFGLSQLALNHCAEHGQSLRRGGFET